PADIKQYLIGFDIVVHPWDFHCFRMGIQNSRGKSANDVSTDFKSLMDRRRLMNSARNRFKILGIKCERIQVAIPTNRIERMMGKSHSSKPRPILDQNIDVFLLIDRDNLL